jgi:Ca2+-binding EF-hand superfamily protein
MELRESFELADADGSDGLSESEFIEYFGDVIGKGMTYKQLRSLFMKIDADAGTTVGKFRTQRLTFM